MGAHDGGEPYCATTMVVAPLHESSPTRPGTLPLRFHCSRPRFVSSEQQDRLRLRTMARAMESRWRWPPRKRHAILAQQRVVASGMRVMKLLGIGKARGLLDLGVGGIGSTVSGCSRAHCLEQVGMLRDIGDRTAAATTW